MSFGGFFGGGSKEPSKDSSSADSSSSSSSNFFPTGATAGSAASQPPSEIRQKLQSAIAMQSNIANARFLIEKVNENCFEHCIPNPGSSLSAKDQTCLSACMEKYIESWNLTSRTFNSRLHKDSLAAGVGTLGGAGGSGKELF